jgi:PTH1 family peptidyl-tRNA hydrolase
MWLIAGLGNPGPRYADNRHNAGFMAVDALARAFHTSDFSGKFDSHVAKARIGGEECLLVKPQTFMNLSGAAIQKFLAFHKIIPANLLVLHDELDLPLGKLRLKQGGGANGHNGIKDIDARIGPDYWRLRLGIGHPGEASKVHSYVLSDFTGDEAAQFAPVLRALAEQFPLFFTQSPQAMMSKVALALQPPAAM